MIQGKQIMSLLCTAQTVSNKGLIPNCGCIWDVYYGYVNMFVIRYT